LAKTNVRKQFTSEKNGNKKIKINGREFELAPRKDGRFNLIAKGQRGAAGSTAILGSKEAKELREELSDFSVVTVEFEDTGDTILYKKYLTEENNNENFETPSKDLHPAVIDAEIVKEEEAGYTVTADGFTYPTAEPYGTDLAKINLDGETSLIVQPDGYTSKGELDIMEAKIIESDIPEEEIRTLANVEEGEPLKLRHRLMAGAVRSGAIVGGTAGAIHTSFQDKLITTGLNDIQGALEDINREAKKDIILGKPIGFINSGSLFLARKANSYYSALQDSRDDRKTQQRYSRVESYRSRNRESLQRSQNQAAEKIRTEKLQPLETEYHKLMETLNQADSKRAALTEEMKAMKAHPLLKTTDAQIEAKRRNAAKNKDAETLLRISQFVEAREKAQRLYEQKQQEYRTLPTVRTMKPQIDTLKSKTQAVKTEMNNVYKTVPAGYKPPYDEREFMTGPRTNKILSLFSGRLRRNLGGAFMDANLDSVSYKSRYSRF